MSKLETNTNELESILNRVRNLPSGGTLILF